MSAPPALVPLGVRQAMEASAARRYPHEACGLLLGRLVDAGSDITEMVDVRNLNTDRARDRYELDPEGFLAADQRARASGMDVVGVWHSHPDHPARPSETDRAHAWEGYVYLIVSVRAGEPVALRGWRLVGGVFVEVEVHESEVTLRSQEGRT